MSARPEALAAGLRRKERQAVAQALNLVEDARPAARARIAELLRLVREDVAEAGHVVGVTGPPGVGKSTLSAALARTLRRRGKRVGVVAVDPSSLASGGSLLGDRARMGDGAPDPGLFIRSLATGGHAGGLSDAAPAAIRVLLAAHDVVLVETTGVGQTETEVRDVVDTVTLIVQPGSGDTLQFLKAGVMEIPDLLVVNKADQETLATRALSDLRSALATAERIGLGGQLAILATSATTGRGLEELADALEAHHAAAAPALPARRRAGEVAWAAARFQARHGSHGVAQLGGPDALRARIADALPGSAVPLVVDALSTSLLDHLKGAGAPKAETPS